MWAFFTVLGIPKSTPSIALHFVPETQNPEQSLPKSVTGMLVFSEASGHHSFEKQFFPPNFSC